MKRLALIIWFIILITGIGIYFLKPQLLESIVCYPHETITTNPEYGSGLYCINDTNDVREVSSVVVLPYMAFIVATPILILFIGALEYLSNPKNIPNPTEITWKKRFIALSTSILNLLGIFLHYTDSDYERQVHVDYKDLWREARVKWAYFFGNPTPLVEYYAELDAKTKAKKRKT